MSKEPEGSTRARIGTIVSVLGALVALLTLLFGRGYLLEIALRPRLDYTRVQLSTDSKTLNACTIQNNGRSNATDVIVHLWIDEHGPPFNELNIQSNEGNAEVRAGGVGNTYAYVYLARLVRTHSVTVTAATLAPVTFHCRVADDAGPGQVILQDPFVLRPGDFIVLFLVGCLLAAVMLLIVYRLPRSWKVKSFDSDQEDRSSTT